MAFEGASEFGGLWVTVFLGASNAYLARHGMDQNWRFIGRQAGLLFDTIVYTLRGVFTIRSGAVEERWRWEAISYSAYGLDFSRREKMGRYC